MADICDKFFNGSMFLIILIPLIIFPIISLYLRKYKDYVNSSYYNITGNSYFDVNTDLGKIGEYSLYKELKNFEVYNCRFLFNLYIPKEDGTFSEVDILMITTKGIIVIESKNFNGWIFGNENQYKWVQTFPARYGCNKKYFYNPIRQNKNHIYSLKKIINKNIPVFSVIAFADTCTLKNITIYSDTIVDYYKNIEHNIESQIFNKFPDVLSPQKIDNLYEYLYTYTQVDSYIKDEHINNIKNKYIEQNDESIIGFLKNTLTKNYSNSNNSLKYYGIIFLILFLYLFFFYLFFGKETEKDSHVELKQDIVKRETVYSTDLVNENINDRQIVINENEIKEYTDKDILYTTNESVKITKAELKEIKRQLKKIKKEEKLVLKQNKQEMKRIKKELRKQQKLQQKLYKKSKNSDD